MSTIRLLRCVKKINLLYTNPINNASEAFKPLIINKSYISTSRFLRSSDESSSENENRKRAEGEDKLIDMLRKRFPLAKAIEVNDISGGCGSMYAIYVETVEFKNLRTVKQHQLINECLRAEIKDNMHGLRIYTAVPKN